MKVGTSLSRCVKDIYEGVVNINDVVVVVARTDFDPAHDDHWYSVWNGYGGGGRLGSMYSNPEWSTIPAKDEQAIRDICISLKNEGKLHQPRQFGAHPQRMAQYWYDMILTDDVVQSNPAAKKAWDNYKTIAGLS
jgi:hypothetical protein